MLEENLRGESKDIYNTIISIRAAMSFRKNIEVQAVQGHGFSKLV